MSLYADGLISGADVDRAIEYQTNHPEMKIGEIFHILNVCNDEEILKVLGERFNIEYVILKDKFSEGFRASYYIPINIMREAKVVPFHVDEDTKVVSVAYANPDDGVLRRRIDLLLMQNGYKTRNYIAFSSDIDAFLDEYDKEFGENNF